MFKVTSAKEKKYQTKLMWANDKLRRETLEEAKHAAAEAKEQSKTTKRKERESKDEESNEMKSDEVILIDEDEDNDDVENNYESDSDYLKKPKTWTPTPQYWREVVEYLS